MQIEFKYKEAYDSMDLQYNTVTNYNAITSSTTKPEDLVGDANGDGDGLFD